MVKPVLYSRIGTETELLQYVKQILQASRENILLFADARPMLSALEDAFAALRNSRKGDRSEEPSLRKAQADSLRALLYDYARYVILRANNDAAVIAAAGFALEKPRTEPIGIPPQPEELLVELKFSRDDSSAFLRTTRWKPARFYQFEYRIVGRETAWTAVLSSKSRVEIKGLEYGQEYEFRVSYLATDPSLNYSAVVRCFVD